MTDEEFETYKRAAIELDLVPQLERIFRRAAEIDIEHAEELERFKVQRRELGPLDAG